MAAPLDIELLKCFVTVVDAGAMTRAAARVGRSQAAISQQMARLEDIVGKPLLHRTGRGVFATVHGERLLVHARTILRAHDDALAELAGQGLEGTLRFGCPDDYASAFLPPLLRSFAELHPGVAIEVVCASTPRLIGQLSRNALDLALASVPKGSSRAVLRHEDLVWVAARTLKDDRPPDPLRLALGDPDALDHLSAVQALGQIGKTYQLAYSSGSLSGLLAVVRSEQAIAVLTRAAVPSDLRILSKSSGLPKLPAIGLVVEMDTRRASALAKAFEAHIRAMLPTL